MKSVLRRVQPLKKAITTTPQARSYAKLTYDQYPFLKELGIEAENNAGTFYNGKWHHGKQIVESLNPATNEPIATVSVSNAEQYHAFANSPDLEKAKRAWALTPAPLRGEIVRQIGDKLRKHRDALGKLVSLEVCTTFLVLVRMAFTLLHGRWVKLYLRESVKYRSTLIFVTLQLDCLE